MATTIPITLTTLPVPVGIQALNINQLFQLWTNYVEASIDNSGFSFFLQGAIDPSTDVGLFFNTAANKFKVWNSSSGRYLPITDLQIGDSKISFVGGDELSSGWVVCDGRAISNIVGLSQIQKGNLQSLFGTTGNIPTLAAQAGITGLPAVTTASSIAFPDITPANNVIGSLPFSAAYTATESEALRDDTETLRDATQTLTDGVKNLQTVTTQFLSAVTAVQSGSAFGTWKIWAGYP